MKAMKIRLGLILIGQIVLIVSGCIFLCDGIESGAARDIWAIIIPLNVVGALYNIHLLIKY